MRADHACANMIKEGDHWYRMAGVARNENTRYDGMVLEGARKDLAPNDGCAVYIEIAEPDFAGPRVMEVAGQRQGDPP